MAFISGKCPNCGRELKINETETRVKCSHCGRHILIKRKRKPKGTDIVKSTDLAKTESSGNYQEQYYYRRRTKGTDIAKWTDLAETASSSGNYQEAYYYYKKILENQPQNYKAWFGKGEAAGWMSTIQDPRLPETVAGIRKAIEYCPEENRKELLERALNVIDSIAKAYFSLAGQHFETICSLDGSHQEYINRCRQLSAELLSAAELFPKSTLLLETILLITRDSAEDKDFWDGGVYSTFCPTTEAYKSSANDSINAVVAKIRTVDPSYEYKQSPVGQKGDNSGCFIATAALGSPHHPNVILLRQFRDSHLSKIIGGHFLISLYGIFSPPLARIIRQNKILQAFAVLTFVQPLARIAKWVDRFLGIPKW